MKYIRLLTIAILSLFALPTLTSCYDGWEEMQSANPYPVTERYSQPFYLNIKVYDIAGQDMCELGAIKPGDVYAEYNGMFFNLDEDVDIKINDRVVMHGLSVGDPIAIEGVDFQDKGKVLRFGALDMVRNYPRGSRLILHWSDGSQDVIRFESYWVYDTKNKWWRFPSTRVWVNNGAISDKFFHNAIIVTRPYLVEG